MRPEPATDRARGPELGQAMKWRDRALKGIRIKRPEQQQVPLVRPRSEGDGLGNNDDEEMSEERVVNEWRVTTEGVQWGMRDMVEERVWGRFPKPTLDSGKLSLHLETAGKWERSAPEILADGSGLERVIDEELVLQGKVDEEALQKEKKEYGGEIVRGPNGGAAMFTVEGQRVGGILEAERVERERVNGESCEVRLDLCGVGN